MKKGEGTPWQSRFRRNRSLRDREVCLDEFRRTEHRGNLPQTRRLRSETVERHRTQTHRRHRTGARTSERRPSPSLIGKQSLSTAAENNSAAVFTIRERLDIYISQRDDSSCRRRVESELFSPTCPRKLQGHGSNPVPDTRSGLDPRSPKANRRPYLLSNNSPFRLPPVLRKRGTLCYRTNF